MTRELAGDPLYCDVSLPVPLDQPFTYRMPETLRHRVQAMVGRVQRSCLRQWQPR